MAATRPTLPAGPSRGAVSNLAAAGGGSAPSAQPPEPHTSPSPGAPGSQAGSLTRGAGASPGMGTTTIAPAELSSPAGLSRPTVPSSSAAGGQTTPSAAPPQPHTTPFAGAPGAQAGSWTFRSAEGMAQPQFSRPEEVPGFASTVLAGSASAGQQSQPTQGPPEAAGQVAIPTSAPSGTPPTTAKDALSTPPTSKAPRRAKT